MADLNLQLPPPPVGNEVNSPSFRDWFFKLSALVLASFQLENMLGVLPVEHGGTGSALGIKVYEPVIGAPTEILYNDAGDILMAWGGEYVS
jgi:hypothetical protein